VTVAAHAALALTIALGRRQRRIGPVGGQSRFAFMSRQSRSFRGFVVFHGVIGKSVGAGKALEQEGGENEMGVDAEHVVILSKATSFTGVEETFPAWRRARP
jgi:hypothetical protein